MTYDLKSQVISVENTRRLDKPNEDCFIVDDDKRIYILADGVSSTPRQGDPYPDPAGGQLAAHTFCQKVYEYLDQRQKALKLRPAEVVKRALVMANRAIYTLNQTYNRYNEANFVDLDYFGTVGTVVIGAADKFYIAHVGDAMVLLRRKKKLKLVTEVQTKRVAEYRRTVKAKGLMGTGQLAIDIRKNFRNNLRARGINGEAVGYGVFTGEETVLDFIQVCEVPMRKDDVLFVASDGLSPLIDQSLNGRRNARLFCQLLDENPDTLDWIIEANEQFEKRSDDKTAIRVTVAAG